MQAYRDALLIINKSTSSEFCDNSAQILGGAVGIAMDCNISIIRCQFNNNEADVGGIVSNFSNNTAAYEGGEVISIVEDSYLIIVNCQFNRNAAQRGDGGVSFIGDDRSAFINGSQFYSSKSHRGGVIHIGSQSPSVFHNCIITSCE